jgi:polyhydroxybutyrate depolymerase
MKKLYKLHSALITCLTFLSMYSFSQTTIIDSMPFGGVQRTYRLYIPAKYKSTTAVPLVFNLHGLGSNATEQEAYGDFRPIADTANFIIAHANGTKTAGSQGWNNFAALGTGVDDVGFISALIDKISNQYSIDKNRIYSTGMSNGGFMSYDLACFLNTRIAAIASVTGSMIASHLKGCKANRPTPVMEIHGTADNTVSYDGKGGIIASTNIDTLVNFWAKFNGCSAPVVSTLPNINTMDGCTVEHQVYNNGKNGSTVELYKVIGGGHSWPGASVIIGVTNQDFSASKEIWRFFSQFRLNQVTAVDAQTGNIVLDIFPNPSSNGFEIRTSEVMNFTVQLFNSVGQKLLETKSENGSVLVSRDNLPAGVYVIQVSYADHQVFKKVVLN